MPRSEVRKRAEERELSGIHTSWEDIAREMKIPHASVIYTAQRAIRNLWRIQVNPRYVERLKNLSNAQIGRKRDEKGTFTHALRRSVNLPKSQIVSRRISNKINYLGES